jgi:hypothetical protein
MYTANVETVAVDWTSVQLNTFAAVCAVAFHPIDRQAIDKAVEAASCKASGKSPEEEEDSERDENDDSIENMPTRWTGAKSIVVPIATTASVSVPDRISVGLSSDKSIAKRFILVRHDHSASLASPHRRKQFILFCVGD